MQVITTTNAFDDTVSQRIEDGADVGGRIGEPFGETGKGLGATAGGALGLAVGRVERRLAETNV